MPDPRRYSVGIVNHGTFDDLENCIESVEAQTCSAARVAVWDTGVDPERLSKIAARFPSVTFLGGENRGYAGGANGVIQTLVGKSPPDFVLVLNPDIVLDPDFAEILIGQSVDASEVAIATGKLLRPDRRTIDSAGIRFPRHRRPRDRGSEEEDRGQYDVAERVEGASGAAMWIRVAAIETLEIEGELFDESFFAYHEDTDLCWRARRLGFDVLYAPAAVAIHARGWQKSERMQVPESIRRHSFKNHYLQVVKNETRGGLLRNLPWLLGWEVLRLGFVLLRDRDLLPAYRDAFELLGTAFRRRRLLNEKVRDRSHLAASQRSD